MSAPTVLFVLAVGFTLNFVGISFVSTGFLRFLRIFFLFSVRTIPDGLLPITRTEDLPGIVEKNRSLS